GANRNALRVPTGGAGNGGAASKAPSTHVVSSGTNYQPGQLAAQVSAVLTRQGGNAAGPAPENQPAGSGPRTPACVPHIAGGKRPLLVDSAHYQGRPATVIVIPGATPGTLRAIVVAGGCTTTAGPILATTTLPARG
ncbi:MAG: hypothetical protein J2P30_19550, partial [Actinobacteria bacterium]|nr:hypothetical protein [Actinomycetota bacterium]